MSEAKIDTSLITGTPAFKLILKEIADKIESQCEVHKTKGKGGMEFYGTSWAQICRVLYEYGHKENPPF